MFRYHGKKLYFLRMEVIFFKAILWYSNLCFIPSGFMTAWFSYTSIILNPIQFNISEKPSSIKKYIFLQTSLFSDGGIILYSSTLLLIHILWRSPQSTHICNPPSRDFFLENTGGLRAPTFSWRAFVFCAHIEWVIHAVLITNIFVIFN